MQHKLDINYIVCSIPPTYALKRHRLLQRLSDDYRTKGISLNPFQIYVRHVLSKFTTSILAYSQEFYSIGKSILYVDSR